MKYIIFGMILLIAVSTSSVFAGGYLAREVNTTTAGEVEIAFTSTTPARLESVIVTMPESCVNTCKIWFVIGSVSNLLYDEGSSTFTTGLWMNNGARLNQGDFIKVENTNTNVANVIVSYSYFTSVPEYD